jgi:voltage-gated potassium channel
MHKTRLHYFISDVLTYTPLLKLMLLLVLLWVLFSMGIFYSEQGVEGSRITSMATALYWGVAAFSTAGIADTPSSPVSMLIGGVWIVVGSGIFFGTIVATITTYFSRPLHRPAKQIVDTIEYNLEQLEDLTVEELDLLKETVDNLILHMEQLKQADTAVGD